MMPKTGAGTLMLMHANQLDSHHRNFLLSTRFSSVHHQEQRVRYANLCPKALAGSEDLRFIEIPRQKESRYHGGNFSEMGKRRVEEWATVPSEAGCRSQTCAHWLRTPCSACPPLSAPPSSLASPRFTSTGKQTSGVIPLLFSSNPTTQTLTPA